MNIKETAHRAVLSAAAFVAVALTAAPVHAFTPDPVSALSLTTGTVAGSLRLNWLSGSDGAGGNAPAFKYEIRYAFSVIVTTSDFAAAIRVEQPPTNATVPAPLVASSSQSLVITGLQPGVAHCFAIRAVNVDGSTGPIVASPLVMATSDCQADPNDGRSVATVACPTFTVNAGTTTAFDLSLSIGGPGIDTGGKIAVRVPDFWPAPSTMTVIGAPGSIQILGLPGSGIVSTDGQTIIFKNTGAPLGTGTFSVRYFGFTCENQGQRKFVTLSQYTSCGVLRPATPVHTVTAQAGFPQFIDFQNYDLSVLVGAVNRVDLRVTDACRNPTVTAATVSVSVAALVRSGGSFVTSTTAYVAASPTMLPLGPNVTINIPALAGSASFYYKITTAANKPEDYIRLQHNDIQNGNPISWFGNVRPVTGGIMQASVDTGLLIAGQNSVSFTPDGDGTNDSVFINFTLPDVVPWMVEISSTNFTTVCRHLYGNSIAARIAWDGFTDGAPNAPPFIAPSGVYKMRISFGGGQISDSSLQAQLVTAGLTCVVKDPSSNPLSDVDVSVYGPANRYARSDSSGTVAINGLKAGTYTVQMRKQGYSTVEVPATLTAGNVLALSPVTMVKQSVMRLFVTRPVDADLPEIWGQVRANNSDWSKQEWGTIHFGRGKTQSDAGDLFNVVPTSYTTLTLAPTVNYRLHFEVPNLKVADSTATLTTNEDRPAYYDLLRSANITGNVFLPAAGTTGLWASVEAGPDANQDGVYDNQDPTKRYFGGVWLAPGETSGRYQIFGVNNGSYTVTATAPGYIPQKRQVIVANDQDAVIDFAALGTGGVIIGTITVAGNTSALDSMDGATDGFFPVSVNAWSASLQVGSYQQVRIATAAAGSTGVFTITGLSDGVYDLYSNLRGYEVVPAGRKTVTVTAGNGTTALNFAPYGGSLTGNITLPGAASDYGQVTVSLKPYDWNLSSVSVTASSATYTFTGLGTGYYQLTAVYGTSGLTVSKSVQIVNGKQSQVDLDMSGPTYTITGRVQTSARSPYNQVSYLVDSSTPTHLIDVNGAATGADFAANRIAVERIDGNNNDQNNNGGSTTGQQYFDSRKTQFVYFDANGDFTIPKLTPGSYRLKNNGEMNNSFSDGPEIAEATLVVRVATANATGQILSVIDGYDVTGTIRIDSADVPSDRSVRLRMKNSAGTVVSEQTISMAGNTSVDFTIARIPDGDYLLSADDTVYPKSFSAKDVSLQVKGASPDPSTILLLKPAQIRGKLRIKTSGTLLTSRNFDQFLSSNFSVEARANPWFSGGSYRNTEPLIDSDGNFVVAANPGKYDVVFQAYQALSAVEIAQGKKAFVPKRISGIEVSAGQALDLGVIDLVEGSVLKGTVRDRNGNPLPNIAVLAYPSRDRHDDSIVTATNELGEFSLQGIDTDGARFYDVIAAPRNNGNDSRLSSFDGAKYGEVRRVQIDTRAGNSVDFVLEPALGSVKGLVATPDGGALDVPFGEDGGGHKPGAEIIMNKVGEIPQDNPLGNIEITTQADGSFVLKGLTPGTYSLWALARGYGSGFIQNIVVSNSQVDIGTVTLQAGQTLYGTLRTQKGTPPNSDQVNVVVAVRNGFEELLVGDVTEDAAGNITAYSISGFQTDKAYSILAFNDENDIQVLAENLVVNGLTERNFIINGRAPAILTQYTKAPDGTIAVQYDFTKAIRNSAIDLDSDGVADDSDPAKIIKLVSGGGTLTYPTDWLSSDRRRAHVTYTPAAGEQRFSLRVAVTFDEVNNVDGANYTATTDFNYFLGIGKQKEQKFTNANGGTIQLEEDTSEFSAGAGTFGSGAEDEINVTFRVADTAGNFTVSGANPRVSRVMSVADNIGVAAYPSEMSAAITKAKALAVDPFSSFYDIFLPAGVSHFFPQGKEAQLCLAYDASVADPYALNVYYYNTTSNEYLLEDTNKAVDTDNQRICVSLSHASVFTVLNSSLSVINGAGYTGDLNVMNFPNPFDLKTKVVTLQDPGTASASQTIEGTMIKISVPASMAGSAEVEIFSVTGERVRTLHPTVSSGAHNYVEWDGRNDGGTRVASGTYIGRLTIGGGNEKFFKLAVLK